ncbi:hypothetical protein AB0A81_39180 [Streptomyces flaveolus]|uniref:hypothetical protein n=1 Tax=Streptomyces flaveolus TaxID=67297 RepID=UPI0033D69C50
MSKIEQQLPSDCICRFRAALILGDHLRGRRAHRRAGLRAELQAAPDDAHASRPASAVVILIFPMWHQGHMVFGNSCIGGDVFWTIARNDVMARCFDQMTVLECFEGP